MADRPPALIAIPTAGRPAQLRTALASIAEQAQAAGVPILVLDDAPPAARTRASGPTAPAANGSTAPAANRSTAATPPDPALSPTHAAAIEFGALYAPVTGGGGLNAARNQAVAHPGEAPLIIFVDDDIRAAPGWLHALLHADATQPPQVAAFAGRLIAWLDPAQAPRSCGRHGSWVTELDLGDADQDVRHGWGANLAIRRSWLAKVGPFDEDASGGGDEEQWLDRAAEQGGRVRYIAAAQVLHERVGQAASRRALAASARARGRELRRYETRQGRAPSLAAELRTLAACLAHAALRRCPMGLVLAAHSLGRVEQLLDPRPPRARRGVDDFLSGTSGTVAGRKGQLRRALDAAYDLLRAPRTLTEQLAAGRLPRRRVLTLTIARDPEAFAPVAARLAAGHHEVDVVVEPIDTRGKFERLSAMLAERDLASYDHVLLIDDDITLPRGFTDRLLWATERAGLLLAQPAHRLHSHAAWPVTRRHLRPAARRTAFVEIGPITLLRGEALAQLLPFPPEAPMGWGLDVHWGALAREAGWPIGVVDSTPILHTTPVAAGYDQAGTIDAARSFLATRPYVTRAEAAWSTPAATGRRATSRAAAQAAADATSPSPGTARQVPPTPTAKDTP